MSFLTLPLASVRSPRSQVSKQSEGVSMHVTGFATARASLGFV